MSTKADDIEFAGMDPEELDAEIERICHIDITKLGEELQRGPKIHSQLNKLYRVETRLLRRWTVNLAKTETQRRKYYDGKMSGEHYENNPLPEQMMTKESIKKYMAQDEFIVKVQNILAVQEQKVKVIEDAMTRARSRGYDIKTMLDWVKFQQGC